MRVVQKVLSLTKKEVIAEHLCYSNALPLLKKKQLLKLIQCSVFIFVLVRPIKRYEVIGLVWFYGISTTVGYLMPNPFYTYKQFSCKQFCLVYVHCFVLFNL